jgi:3-hydroxyacyl-CoA dehydrogenase
MVNEAAISEVDNHRAVTKAEQLVVDNMDIASNSLRHSPKADANHLGQPEEFLKRHFGGGVEGGSVPENYVHSDC